MKIAFHFEADHKLLGGYYGMPIRNSLFSAILNSKNIRLNTKIFQGDILLAQQTMKKEKNEAREIFQFNGEKFQSAIQMLFDSCSHAWTTFTEITARKLLEGNVFVVLFESISFRDAMEVDHVLRIHSWYLGTLQINDSCPVHRVTYGNTLVAGYRIIGRDIYQFWDGICDDSKDEGHAEELAKIGFSSVGFEAAYDFLLL